MKTVHIGMALCVALIGQTAVVPAIAGGGVPVDLPLIVVVFVALSRGPMTGLWVGTIAGFLQDALSGTIIGVSGLAKTITGFLVGLGGARFVVGTMWHRFVALMFFHAFVYIGVYTLIGFGGLLLSIENVVVQSVVNGLAGIFLYFTVRTTPAIVERLRQGRNPLSRRSWIMS